MIGEQRAFLLQKVQQARHLFEVGWNVRDVAAEMNIVELDVDWESGPSSASRWSEAFRPPSRVSLIGRRFSK